MKGIKIIFWILWRIWFYILIAVPILVFFPILILTILSEKGYPYFFRIARIWAKFILFGMGFYYKVDSEQTIDEHKSYMIVANHTSMTDIMLMLAVVKNPFVFVGKQELAKIPLFGFFYKRTCILVDRKNSQSRMAVFTKAQKRIQRGLSVCIFPEGGVPDDESVVLDHFKEGAFKLAIQHQIPILPISFGDNKERLPYTFFAGSPGIMRVKIHKQVETLGKTESDRKEIRESVRATIYNQLVEFESEKKIKTA
ncbi:lysophospholipid acyltransferase family protein [Flavobacterium seoulense]|uniref:1-acyl-sn-glycerol-3-phosphate acyltransferase n=1 Tax=Flavobacterium seoulense TaxID=1492738 RepID=A0A066WN98_9FLAO|nr:lysophospholipid acyltransferase family protein [Flavobacterium seoulense]KDN54078.1 1-acyl-sn-glycerol-3-phosphate acyltransferase [Flavobacterium seoulense]